MRAQMKNLVPALILALAACSTPSPSTGDDRPIARAVTGQMTTSEQAQKLKDKNIGGGDVVETPGSKVPEIDTTRRLEYADVTVALGDPNGMRALVPYLMKPEI